MPRVLICSFDVVPSPAGGPRRLTEYFKALNGRFQVVAMTLKTPDVSHIERFHGARLLRVPVGTGDLPSRIQAFERAVRRQLESEEYVLVHFTDPFGGYPLCELRQELGYRLVYDAQSFASEELPYTHPQLDGDRRFLARVRRQELYCLMNADAVITGSATAARSLHAFGVTDDQVRVLRPPVDVAAYASKVTGEPTGDPARVLYLGSQVGWQGLPTLVRAMHSVSQATRATLRIVGPRHSAWQKRLEDLVAELDLAGRVRFEPGVAPDELPKLLAESDICVLPIDDVPRNRAGFAPLAKVSDYLAAGRPVVAADLPVARDRVPHVAARYFRPGDPADLAEQLIALARDPALRAELGKFARAEAQGSVNAPLVRTALLEVYAELLGRSAIPTPVEPAEERNEPTATPTSRIFGRGDSGPTPTNQLVPHAEPPAARAAAPAPPVPDTDPGSPRPFPEADEYTYPSAPGPRWAAESGGKWKTGSALSHDLTPTGVRLALEAEEPEEISSDEIVEAEAGAAPSAPSPAPQGGADPWLALLLHGYCPPEGVQFSLAPQKAGT